MLNKGVQLTPTLGCVVLVQVLITSFLLALSKSYIVYSKRNGQTNALINISSITPESKVHEANMGPIWGRQDPGGPHVGPMNFVIWDFINTQQFSRFISASNNHLHPFWIPCDLSQPLMKPAWNCIILQWTSEKVVVATTLIDWHYSDVIVGTMVSQITSVRVTLSLGRLIQIMTAPEIMLGMGPANESRRYVVTSSLIGWTHTQ